MSMALTREELLQSYLVGEQIRAKQNGYAWNRDSVVARFEQFLMAERFDAIGVTQEAVDVGARTLMRGTQIGWDHATPEQRQPWQAAMHGALVAVRDLKKGLTSPRSHTTRAHGTRTKYIKDGCHCSECTKANAEYQNRLRERKKGGERPLISAERSRNTLRALVAEGNSPENLARDLGYASSSILDIFGGHARSVRPETEEKIIRLAQWKAPARRAVWAS